MSIPRRLFLLLAAWTLNPLRSFSSVPGGACGRGAIRYQTRLREKRAGVFCAGSAEGTSDTQHGPVLCGARSVKL